MSKIPMRNPRMKNRACNAILYPNISSLLSERYLISSGAKTYWFHDSTSGYIRYLVHAIYDITSY